MTKIEDRIQYMKRRGECRLKKVYVWFNVVKSEGWVRGKRVYRAHVVGQLLICVFMRVTNNVHMYMHMGFWGSRMGEGQ
jgi:hypothetical protein